MFAEGLPPTLPRNENFCRTRSAVHGYNHDMFEDEGDNARRFDTAQICLNGHIINRMVDDHPEANTAHCQDCGQRTITECQHCQAKIRGYKHIPGYSYADTSPAPRFCHACGTPYPWTRSGIEAAQAYADEMSELDEAEKMLLRASIEEIVAESPKTELASARFKRLVAKGGKATADAMRSILIDIASETATKSIWG